MGTKSIRGGEKVQGGEHEQSQGEFIKKAKYYLSNFGMSCVLESTSNDDLKYVWGERSDMPSELYPILVKLAEEEAAELQRSFISEALEEDLREAETEEEREYVISDIKRYKEMTPREFLEDTSKMIDAYHKSSGLDLFGNPKKEN